MIPSLTQESIDQYASNALTIQKPEGTDYSQGAHVNRTIPAKWWNWLFSAVTKRIQQSRADAVNMLTELNNVITDADMQPSSATSNQLSQAVNIHAQRQIDEYIAAEKTQAISLWKPWGTIYLNGTAVNASEAAVRNIRKVSGLYLATVSRADSPVTFAQGVYSSTDLIHWYLAGDPNFDSWGCVHLRGVWILVGGGPSTDDGLYVSKNGIVWEYMRYSDIFPNVPANHYVRNDGCCIGVLENEVYLVMHYSQYPAYSPAPDGVIEHGIALLTTTAIIAVSSSITWDVVKGVDVDVKIPISRYGFNDAVQDIVRLSSNTIAVGAAVIDTTTADLTLYADNIVPLTDAQKERIGVDLRYESTSYNRVLTATVIRLRDNGNISAATVNNVVTYRFTNGSYTNLSRHNDWIVDLQSYVLNPELDVLLLCDSYEDTDVITKFSYDGVNAVDFPTSFIYGTIEPILSHVRSVCKMNGYYYLVTTGATDPNVVGLFKTTLLTDYPTDYEYLGPVPKYSTAQTSSLYNKLTPVRYKNWLVIDKFFTRDEGRNWLTGHLDNNAQTAWCSPAVQIEQNTIYGVEESGLSYLGRDARIYNMPISLRANYVSRLNINYVSGHTLYLQ